MKKFLWIIPIAAIFVIAYFLYCKKQIIEGDCCPHATLYLQPYDNFTQNEAEKLITDQIRPYLKESENPVVTVRMSSFSISVIGEVNEPGTFTVEREKINVLEALSRAGDLTIYGVRNTVTLIREDSDGIKSYHKLDLNDANIVNSPYYYLQQNDILYVEPNKVRAQNAAIGSMTSLWLSATGILVSVATLLVSLLK